MHRTQKSLSLMQQKVVLKENGLEWKSFLPQCHEQRGDDCFSEKWSDLLNLLYEFKGVLLTQQT